MQNDGENFAKIASQYDMQMKTCVEGTLLDQYGFDSSGCMTRQVLEKAIGNNLKLPKGKYRVFLRGKHLFLHIIYSIWNLFGNILIFFSNVILSFYAFSRYSISRDCSRMGRFYNWDVMLQNRKITRTISGY